MAELIGPIVGNAVMIGLIAAFAWGVHYLLVFLGFSDRDVFWGSVLLGFFPAIFSLIALGGISAGTKPRDFLRQGGGFLLLTLLWWEGFVFVAWTAAKMVGKAMLQAHWSPKVSGLTAYLSGIVIFFCLLGFWMVWLSEKMKRDEAKTRAPS